MKDFILKNKWLGFVALLVYALISASVVSKYGNAIVKQYMPVVVQEAEQFLPITLQNGKIVAPENTIISQSYGDENQTINVVLNTRVDEIPSTDLSQNGLYVSKKFIYAVSPQKTEIRSLKELPDGTLDAATLNAGAEAFVKSTQKYLFPVYAVVALLLSMLAVLIYTVIMHWLMAILYKVRFGYTLRVNTIIYALVSIAEILGSFNFGILLMLGTMLVGNMVLNTAYKTEVTA